MCKWLILLIFSLHITACHDYRKDYVSISFGKGGGFTGLYNMYRIENNGNIYLTNNKTNEAIFLKSLPIKQCRLLFKQISKSEISKLQINNPYNMNYFISIISKADTINLVWGHPKTPPGQKVEAIYKVLMETIEKK
jgi:hypothetical protein